MSKPKQKEKPNQRKMAFRQEATDALLQLENDSQVTFEKAMEVAKLDCRQCKLHDISHNAKHQNCRDNPFCINRLGLEKFEKLINLEVQNREDARINQKRRDLNDQPSGLVNNGNFCYVNSFLQVWFSVIEFRQIIYDFRPSRDYIAPELPRMNVERVMMALQDLFFTMQTTPFMDTDKNETLIRELRLNQEQQDAQEFALMLFDALDRNLQLHPNGNPIRERIKNLYMGSTCSRIFCECGMSSERLEVSTSLQLNIDGHATLLDALNANFGVEKLDDYTCSQCGKKGRVSRRSDYAELPPVVIIQLNRYKYTSKGRQKLKTTLAYPREISAGIFKQNSTDIYELFAVTIHEGNNAECGHYYDLIKSPLNQKWYRYNDATVEALQKPPGTEKPTTEINAKAKRAKNEKILTDQKACYGLLYRKKDRNLPISHPKLPPEEMIQESKRKIEEMFEGQTKSKIEKSEKRLYDLQRRVEKLKNNLSKLETHEGKFQHPNEIAFLPTSLISNILEGEFEIAKGNKNTGKKSINPPENQEKSQEENEETQAENPTEIPVENPPAAQENLDILAIAMTSSELLPNLPENEERRKTRAQNGITKSVFGHSGSAKSPRKEKLIKLPISSQVSNLLDSHEMPICGHGKMSIESILFGDVKAVSRAPAISLLREYDYRAKMVFDDGRREYPQPEKEKEVFVFTAEDICMDCVLEMRIEGMFNDRLEDDDRLARKILKEEKLRCSVKCPLPKPDDYFYVAKVALMNFKKMANNERQFKLNRVLTKGGTLFFDSVQSQKQDAGFADVCTNLKRLRWKSSSNKKPEGIPPEKMAKLDNFLEPEDLGSLEMESTSSSLNLPPNIVQLAVADDQTRPSSRSTPASNMVSQPVEFNGELRCAHGGINYNQFRHAVSPEEWQRLIHYFDDNFEVHCNDQVCDLCQQQEEDAQNGSLNMRILVREMRKRLTDTLKNIDLREENAESSEIPLEFGICSVFLDKLRKLTQRNATSPPHICQNCLLCPEHSRPFKGFHSLLPEKKDAYIVGLTAEEWLTITQEIQKLEEVEEKTNNDTPHVILIANSARTSEAPSEEDRGERSVVDLCHGCYEQNIRRIEEMKYQFENELVYVKLVQPNDDCAETTKNRGAAKSTRRRKDIIGVKLSSSSRLLDLKIALYDKCYQSPTDQLLYRVIGGELLDATCHEKTLYELKLLPNNNDNPLILMANTNAAVHSTLPEDANSDRAPERGFVDTALAH